MGKDSKIEWTMNDQAPNAADYSGIHDAIVTLLEDARHAASRSVNALMTATYWEVGRRIIESEQGGQDRATYGEELIKRLGNDLSRRFGRGFGWRNLTQMRAFYLAWPAEQILQTVSAKSPIPQIIQTSSAISSGIQISELLHRNALDLSVIATAFSLPWSAYVRLLSVKNEQARRFYEIEALRCGWSMRQLDRQIGSQFYERTALSLNKAAMLQKAEHADSSDVLMVSRVVLAAHLTYWPSYATLSPESRAAYLEWLADGASAPETNIGYVFLYYYGLEYRLLTKEEKLTADRGERHLLVQEVNRLLAIYGGNSSFRHYATSLLTFLMVQDEMEPPMSSPGRSVTGGEIFGTYVHLGRVVASGQPIPSSLALAWLCVDPETRFRTPASRCWEEFAALFDIRFQQSFPKGFLLKPNQTRLEVVYRPASSGFGGREQKIATDLPDLRVRRKPLENLRLLADKCEGELEQYSRFLGRNPGMVGSLPAMAWLPDPLLPACAGVGSLHRLVEPLLVALQQQERVVIPSAELLQHWPLEKPGQVSKQEMVTILQLLDKFLVGLEPDVRFVPFQMQWDGRACLFRLQEPGVPTASALFQEVAVLLHLSVIMASASKPVSDAKRRHLLSFLNGISGFVAHERARLLAHMEWLLITQPGLTGLKKRLTGKSVADARGWAQFLISLASVDGSVDAGDVAVLTKIYPLLGLQPSEFHADLHTHQLSRHDQEMAVVSLGDGPPSLEYPLPRPPGVDTTRLVRLDGRRVAETMANTAEVHKMLSDIFAGDPDPEESSAIVASPHPIGLEVVAGLDGEYLRLFYRMTEQTIWERKVFDALCSELGLFPDGALEILNEAAYALCGSPLLDGEDPVEVDMEIVKEMRACPMLTK